jgi:ornithine--oxo-acid transaminase
MGRTGSNFAFQREGFVPDASTLGKALGGGFLPVSALVGSREVMDVFRPGDHGSTFGGNPLGVLTFWVSTPEPSDFTRTATL